MPRRKKAAMRSKAAVTKKRGHDDIDKDGENKDNGEQHHLALYCHRQI